MKKIISLTKYNTTLLFRDMNSVLFSFLMPIGFYILFANMLKGIETGGASMQTLLVPLYTIIIIGNAVISVFGGFYAQARESGNLVKYKFLGINELMFSSCLYAATIIFQFLVITAFLIFTRVYGKIIFPVSQLAPIIILLSIINFYQFAVSYILNAVIRRSALYNSISLTFYMFQMFLGGLTFPMEMFPKFLRDLVYVINPIIYGRNALIDVWADHKSLAETASNIWILLAVSFGLILAGNIINRLAERGRTQMPVAER